MQRLLPAPAAAIAGNRRMTAAAGRLPAPVELIGQRIYLLRGQKVMLDSDLAELYRVPTFRLNEAVKRNQERFPEDFMFQLLKEEAASSLRSWNMKSSGKRSWLRLTASFRRKVGTRYNSARSESSMTFWPRRR